MNLKQVTEIAESAKNILIYQSFMRKSCPSNFVGELLLLFVLNSILFTIRLKLAYYNYMQRYQANQPPSIQVRVRINPKYCGSAPPARKAESKKDPYNFENFLFQLDNIVDMAILLSNVKKLIDQPHPEKLDYHPWKMKEDLVLICFLKINQHKMCSQAVDKITEQVQKVLGRTQKSISLRIKAYQHLGNQLFWVSFIEGKNIIFPNKGSSALQIQQHRGITAALSFQPTQDEKVHAYSIKDQNFAPFVHENQLLQIEKELLQDTFKEIRKKKPKKQVNSEPMFHHDIMDQLQEKARNMSPKSRKRFIRENIDFLRKQNEEKKRKLNEQLQKIELLAKLDMLERQRLKREEQEKRKREVRRSVMTEAEKHEEDKRQKEEYHQQLDQKIQKNKKAIIRETEIVKNMKIKLLQMQQENQKYGDDLQDQLRQLQQKNRQQNIKLQALRGTCRVFCKVRPAEQKDQCIFIESSTMLRCQYIEDAKNQRKPMTKPETEIYIFEKIFDENMKNEEMFNQLSQVVDRAIDGENILIIADGQTGSGKTHTLFGPRGQEEKDYGVVYRSIIRIFQQIQAMEQMGVSLSLEVSIEESVKDGSKDGFNDLVSGQKLIPLNQVRQTIKLTSEQQAIASIQILMQSRKQASTKKNQRSSRSHVILTFSLKKQQEDTIGGRLIIIDLIGSERTDKELPHDPKRVNETSFINSSRGAFLRMFQQIKNNEYVSKRDSMLTIRLEKLFKDNTSKKYKCKILMIVNISPDSVDRNPTRDSLKFAEELKHTKL